MPGPDGHPRRALQICIGQRGQIAPLGRRPRGPCRRKPRLPPSVSLRNSAARSNGGGVLSSSGSHPAMTASMLVTWLTTSRTFQSGHSDCACHSASLRSAQSASTWSSNPAEPCGSLPRLLVFGICRKYCQPQRGICSPRGVGQQRRADTGGVRGELEVPQFVGVDLAQPEAGAIGDQPLVGADTAHVDRLADHVLGTPGCLHVPACGGQAAVGGDGVVEQALLELRGAPPGGDGHLDALGRSGTGGLLDRAQQSRVEPADLGVLYVERRDDLPIGVRTVARCDRGRVNGNGVVGEPDSRGLCHRPGDAEDDRRGGGRAE